MAASTITTNDICGRVRSLWAPLLAQNLVPRADHNIGLAIWAGMERLAKAIKDSSDRPLLITELTNKTPVLGVIDLSTATYANFLIDTFRLPGAINTSAESAVVFNHVATLSDLKLARQADLTCVWYHLRGKNLIFRNPVTPFALNTYVTPVNLAGSYIPLLGSATLPLPFELEGQLIDRVAELMQKLGGLQFLTMDEEKAGETVRGLPK